MNNDGTPEYSPFSQANAITVTIVNKLTQDDFAFSQATESKLYSGSDFTIVATGSVPSSTVTYTSDDESIAVVNSNTGMVTIKKAGSTSIKATASETADYAQTTATYTLIVDKATITITAKDKAAYRGSTVPAFTVDDYIVTGLRTGETLATLPTLAYETEPDMSQTGTIAIKASGAEAPTGDNYNDIVYVDGTLTISNKPSGGGGGSYTPPAITPETPEVKPDQPIIDAEDTKGASSSKFADVGNHWAKNSIVYVVDRGLLMGTSETTFAPDAAVTRGMLMTVLGRLAEVDAKVYDKSSFIDVANDKYYAPYIEWAYNKGIVVGIGNQKFVPDRAVTREEIAVIFTNYAKETGYTLPITSEASTYADNNSIGDIYKGAVIAMQQAGIMIGDTNNNFNPKSSATRAEVSAMLERYIKLIIEGITE